MLNYNLIQTLFIHKFDIICSRQIASRFNISNSTSYKIVQNNLKYITNISAHVIKWPCGNEQLLTLRKFQNLRNKVLPGVFGAIDGCHIKILAPWVKRKVMPSLNKSMFYNRKQVPTVILQVHLNYSYV